jgi:hypothetical protein
VDSPSTARRAVATPVGIVPEGTAEVGYARVMALIATDR